MQALLIGISPALAVYLTGLLAPFDYEVASVQNFDAAEPVIAGTNAAQILIIDGSSPELPLAEFCSHVRRQYPRPYRYVLVLYGDQMHENLALALTSGVDDSLSIVSLPTEIIPRLRLARRLIAITDLSMRESLAEQNGMDPASGVFSNVAITLSLDRELSRAQRHGGTTAVLFIHVDGFERIAERWGRQNSDLVMRLVGMHIAQAVRRYDLLGRAAGAHFLLIAPETDLLKAKQVAERLQHRIAVQTVSFGEQKLNVSVSIGVAATQLTHSTEVLEVAMQALTRARQKGGNRTECGTANQERRAAGSVIPFPGAKA